MHSSFFVAIAAVLLPVCLGLGDLTCDAWVGATNCAVTGDHVIEALRVSISILVQSCQHIAQLFMRCVPTNPS
jgi:hypothetical protein